MFFAFPQQVGAFKVQCYCTFHKFWHYMSYAVAALQHVEALLVLCSCFPEIEVDSRFDGAADPKRAARYREPNFMDSMRPPEIDVFFFSTCFFGRRCFFFIFFFWSRHVCHIHGGKSNGTMLRRLKEQKSLLRSITSFNKHKSSLTFDSIWLKAILFKRQVACALDVVLLFLFCTPLTRRVMPRRGWSTLEVAAGWLQVIRGPRPPAGQWPKASRAHGQGQKPQISSKKENKRQTEPNVSGSESRRGPPPRVSPAAQDQVVRLQTAVNALGDDNSPEAKMLRDTLKKAQQEATAAPVGVRLDACAQFVERAKNRLLKADKALRKAQDERAKMEQKLREGEQRLEEFRAEASEQVRVAPTTPASGDEVSNLKK